MVWKGVRGSVVVLAVTTVLQPNLGELPAVEGLLSQGTH